MPASQAICKSQTFSATIASDTSVALTRELQCLRKKALPWYPQDTAM
jgi:hypothetical protein